MVFNIWTPFVIQKLNLIEFIDPRSQYCGWFHLLYFLHGHFIKPKAEKRKKQFLVTKSGQKWNLIEFSDQSTISKLAHRVC